MAREQLSIADSSHIQSAAYDEETQELWIAFKRGATYKYSGVSGDVARGFNDALSAGQYFHAFIRNGGFAYEKVG